MLVITRREGEEVVIGDPSKPLGIVRLASIKGDRVRLAFEFPRELAVHRKEVADQIVRDTAEHAGVGGGGGGTPAVSNSPRTRMAV